MWRGGEEGAGAPWCEGEAVPAELGPALAAAHVLAPTVLLNVHLIQQVPIKKKYLYLYIFLFIFIF